MREPIHRRDFLGRTVRFGGGALAGFSALHALGRLASASSRALHGAGRGEGGYGPLVEAGVELALPEGFEYTRFGALGTIMDDDLPTPPGHDGMGAFPLPNGNIRLIRNHELLGKVPGTPPYPRPYDEMTGGGTTSLEVDPESRTLVRSFSSLGGTVRNCAGGVTPWGSWLTCEEATAGARMGLRHSHGYVFEVPASAEGPVSPVPLPAMGRFVHEAVAVDPETRIIYETEDQTRGGFYRFIPAARGEPDGPADLARGGRLQMLGIVGQRRYDCSRGQTVGQPLPVRWVDIPDPDPDDAEERQDAVFIQGWDRGGARFSRVEGCWYADGAICFTSTDGGDAGLGQVWEFRPAGDRGTLTLLFESPDASVLQYPDNVCVSPRGGIVLCEDGLAPNHVRGLTPEGLVFDFARNIKGVGHAEFAGATFSPDGRTLFVNIQNDPGATFAIWGPWENGAL
ncbi:MAG TPA: alkaline phosphatase PhoX [Longimicrobiales bacterium]|nr:alkaline phosphatase PhoX [Longimicrobiales bacterium]